MRRHYHNKRHGKGILGMIVDAIAPSRTTYRNRPTYYSRSIRHYSPPSRVIIPSTVLVSQPVIAQPQVTQPVIAQPLHSNTIVNQPFNSQTVISNSLGQTHTITVNNRALTDSESDSDSDNVPFNSNMVN
jgi:hypothetical protein